MSSSTNTYFYALGRRKTATAQVRLFSGKGESQINGLPVDKYIQRADLFQTVYSPLKTAGAFDTFHFQVTVE
jgi:small subunit ribosomal protein S9